MSVVLVIDDDPGLRRTLDITLRAAGHEVLTAATAREGLDLASARAVDAVVLDLGLPDQDGQQVLQQLRAFTAVPVIVLSARVGEHDKVAALDTGADDYVTKPFAGGELLARLRAALRRSPPTGRRIDHEDLQVDFDARTAHTVRGPVRLTPTEWHLLEVLSAHDGRVVGHRQLLQEVWGPAYATEVNYLRVYIAQLRRKLEPVPTAPAFLLTKPGSGYLLRTRPRGS